MPGTPSCLMTYQMSVQCSPLCHPIPAPECNASCHYRHLPPPAVTGPRVPSLTPPLLCTDHEPGGFILPCLCFMWRCGVEKHFNPYVSNRTNRKLCIIGRRKTRRLSLIRLIFPRRSDSRLDAVFSLFVVCYSDNKDFLFKVPWGSIFEFDFALYLRVTRTCTRTQMGVAFLKVISDDGVTFLSAS